MKPICLRKTLIFMVSCPTTFQIDRSCQCGHFGLYTFSETKTKLQFNKTLHDLVKSVAIPKSKSEDEVFELENLSYGDSSIKKILLLFNIQTILTTNDTDIKFPFHRFKTENWDIDDILHHDEISVGR